MNDNTSVNLGVAQVDVMLRDALVAAGVKEHDASELARLDAFGGAPAGPFISGLRAAATLLNRGVTSADFGTLPDPWATICPALAAANSFAPDQALLEAIAGYSIELQSALIGAVGAVAAALAGDADQSQSGKVISRPSPARTAKVQQVALAMQPIDVAFAQQLQVTLSRKEPHDLRLKRAGERLVSWLIDPAHGEFIRTIHGEHFYLLRESHRLFSLTTNAWQAFLYRLTLTNPASSDFRYFLADCLVVAEYAKLLDVVRVAHWDIEYQLLRVSRFDGQVYRLDGETIELEANGDGPALFNDSLHWMPYEPDYSAGGAIADWAYDEIPHWEHDGDGGTGFSMLLQVWWLSTFFSELCPTRPVLVLKGEKGSGKSMVLRILLKLLFGPGADVSGMPDKTDGFTALASNSHIVVIDNLDELVREIQNKIARLSTGGVDQYRRLYTNNEVGTIIYRCWLAVTSRTPDTLQRDDLVDRSLILPVTRIEDIDRACERRFLLYAARHRAAWWGDTLRALSQIVREIRSGGIPERSVLRLADWEALGRVIARVNGQGDIWEGAVEAVKVRQTQMLLHDDVVLLAIEAWLDSPMYTTRPTPTSELYRQSGIALFDIGRPDPAWPRSVRSFGRRLAGMQRELRDYLAQSGVTMEWRLANGLMTYQFFKGLPV